MEGEILNKEKITGSHSKTKETKIDNGTKKNQPETMKKADKPAETKDRENINKCSQVDQVYTRKSVTNKDKTGKEETKESGNEDIKLDTTNERKEIDDDEITIEGDNRNNKDQEAEESTIRENEEIVNNSRMENRMTVIYKYQVEVKQGESDVFGAILEKVVNSVVYILEKLQNCDNSF